MVLEEGESCLTRSYFFYVIAAFAEIAGCFSFWTWLRLNKPIWVILPGVVSLTALAYFLTEVESDFGAAYGSIYMAAQFV